MNRLDILNHLIQRNKIQSYLEIGVDYGFLFDKINVPHKVGVDPNTKSKATIFSKSDDFFKTNTQTFDLVFIDGLHHANQVEKDILNSLKVLNKNGYIVCHDLLPTSEIMQKVPRATGEWTGDCWKAWVRLRQNRADLFMCVVDADYGCGIIHKGNQKLLQKVDIMDYKNFIKNKYEWMNVISVSKFQEIFV